MQRMRGAHGHVASQRCMLTLSIWFGSLPHLVSGKFCAAGTDVVVFPPPIPNEENCKLCKYLAFQEYNIQVTGSAVELIGCLGYFFFHLTLSQM